MFRREQKRKIYIYRERKLFTAIDYVLENEEAKEEEERLEIGDGLRSPPVKGIEGR